MEKVWALITTIAVGGLISLQAPLNSQLARKTGTLEAAFISFALGTAVLFALVLILGNVGNFGAARDVSWYYLTGGIVGAALVVGTLITVRELGAGGLIAGLLCGQLIVSLLFDKFGLFGLDRIGITPTRLFGVLLVVVGTLIVTR